MAQGLAVRSGLGAWGLGLGFFGKVLGSSPDLATEPEQLRCIWSTTVPLHIFCFVFNRFVQARMRIHTDPSKLSAQCKTASGSVTQVQYVLILQAFETFQHTTVSTTSVDGPNVS